jgi:signal transduction histidine kinase
MPRTVFERYRRLEQYVGWTDADAERLRQVWPLLEPYFRPLVDDFYAEIERHPDARKVITGGQEQIDRLKGSLIRWLRELLSGEYDEAYVTRRWRIGYRHVEIGLEQVFTNVAMSRLRTGLHAALAEVGLEDRRELLDIRQSLAKRIDLDLAIIEDAYQTEYAIRQQRAERLAVIGQVAGGVAHEVRNPLNVIKTSVYYLLNARNASPEKRAEHLARIEKQVGIADGVITALSNFAKMPVPERSPFRIDETVRDVLESLPPSGGITVETDLPASLPRVLADASQVRVVLSNLIRNARDAMPEGGRLLIRATTDDGRVRIAVADTGHGIPAEDLRRILEPFFTTKARGMGLGLAISNAILGKNEGALSVESEVGRGSTFTIDLEAAPAEGIAR